MCAFSYVHQYAFHNMSRFPPNIFFSTTPGKLWSAKLPPRSMTFLVSIKVVYVHWMWVLLIYRIFSCFAYYRILYLLMIALLIATSSYSLTYYTIWLLQLHSYLASSTILLPTRIAFSHLYCIMQPSNGVFSANEVCNYEGSTGHKSTSVAQLCCHRHR